MEEELSRFPEQFSWEPDMVRSEALPPASSALVVCGMGGSHLGAELLLTDPECPPLLTHSDYGLPRLPEAWKKEVLFVASSWSGDTEETLDAAKALVGEGLPVAVMASGGKLADFADNNNLPMIRFPNADLQPRSTMGYQMLGLARLMGDEMLEARVREAGKSLDVIAAKEEGDAFSVHLGDGIPDFYASTRNRGIAYLLKIEMNETGKHAAAYNVVPELNHNELEGYETGSAGFLPILIEDDADHPRVQERIQLLARMFSELGIRSVSFPLRGESALHKSLRAALVGGYAGAALAKANRIDSETVPLISEFKRRLSE